MPDIPVLGDQAWNIAVTGVGGTGVLTIGALLGMAAHIDGQASIILDMAGLAQKGGAVLSHIRLARMPSMVSSPHIVAGSADLLIAADAVVAASRDGIVLCDPARTSALVNTTTAPVASFVRHRDIDFKYSAVEARIAESVKGSDNFHPFGKAAESKVGDTIATNIMMMGYAWQSGLIPLSFNALDTAIVLNAVSVDANRTAFHWGRKLCLDTSQFSETNLQAQSSSALKAPSLNSVAELIEHRSTHLERYQNRALAQKYRSRVEKFHKRCQQLGLDDTLPRTVATEYARLLAYKDEYEVARLYTLPEFHRQLSDTFAGSYNLKIHLAPPLLNSSGSDGRPRKRAFGKWVLTLFRLLQHGKCLRGTALDVFGYSAERRHERQWITWYEEDMGTVESFMSKSSAQSALMLLAIPEQIRGFGIVKQEAMEKAKQARVELLEKIVNHDTMEHKEAA